MAISTTAVPVVSIFEVGDYARQIQEAAALLREGKLVVLPTETVYGAAGVLSDANARRGLRDIRSAGEDTKPFVPHLADRAQAADYLGPVSDLGKRIMRKLWPGPVALMFDVPADRRKEVVHRLAIRENDLYDNGSITLRCPDHIVALDILRETGRPVVVVRGGIQSSQPALRAQQVAEELAGKVHLVIDSGPPRYSKASTMIRITGEKYQIVRAGVYDERIIERLLKTTILFVCSGNTCRSPMAEAITRHIIAGKLNVSENELEKKGISVISAGAAAMPGSRAALPAVEAVRLLGADLSQHRSRPLSVELIHQADVIYAMGNNHAQAVRSLVPSAAEKVMMLAPGREIDDPIGGDSALYKELAGELQSLIEMRLNEQALNW